MRFRNSFPSDFTSQESDQSPGYDRKIYDSYIVEKVTDLFASFFAGQNIFQKMNTATGVKSFLTKILKNVAKIWRLSYAFSGYYFEIVVVVLPDHGHELPERV